MKRYTDVPENLQPLGAWSYFWLSVLYSVPVLGLIFLIIHAIGAYNINKRSYARSFFCGIILVLIIIGVILLISGGFAGLGAFLQGLGTPKE